MTFIIIASIFVFLVSPFVRCLVLNFASLRAELYGVLDTFSYVIHRKWRFFNEYGIDMFVGMFGHGKTLSMTHRARKLYKRFGNTVLFVSNYKLYGIPYVPLVNFNQILELAEKKSPHYSYHEIMDGLPEWYYDSNGHILPRYIEYKKVCYGEDENEYILVKMVKRWQYQGFVVLIDEIEAVLSHRNYASFPLQLLNTLTQQRKKHVYIMCSAQRFFMVDKIFRSITTHVIDCCKFWRFQATYYYNAWDYENAMSPQLIKSMKSRWFFVNNRDFKSYDTEQMIDRNMSSDFISNDETLARIGLDNVVNEMAVQKPSHRLRKLRKRGRK